MLFNQPFGNNCKQMTVKVTMISHMTIAIKRERKRGGLRSTQIAVRTAEGITRSNCKRVYNFRACDRAYTRLVCATIEVQSTTPCN